jgi:hypothetical protein
MSTLARTSNARFFNPCLKSCALYPESSGGTCGSADDSVRILGRGESQDPEFQKESLKLVDEKPTSVMPDEMEKLIRELQRDTEIIALLKAESATNV